MQRGGRPPPILESLLLGALILAAEGRLRRQIERLANMRRRRVFRGRGVSVRRGFLLLLITFMAGVASQSQAEIVAYAAGDIAQCHGDPQKSAAARTAKMIPIAIAKSANE